MSKLRAKNYQCKCRKCFSIFQGKSAAERYCDSCRTRTCKKCGKVWKLYVSITKHAHDFCSVKCANQATLKRLWNSKDFRAKMSVVGKKAGERLTANNIVETKHPRWKGNDVGYDALHSWVNKHLGKARECSNCNARGRSRYHWANVSGKYLRDLSDWKELCVPCHSRFDHKREKCLL